MQTEDIENTIAILWPQFPKLLQLSYKDGILTVWYAVVNGLDLGDPSTWLSDSLPLDQLHIPDMQAALEPLKLALDAWTDPPDGYMPHVWFRPPAPPQN